MADASNIKRIYFDCHSVKTLLNDVAELDGDKRHGMVITIDDDGKLDIYVTNEFSAGNFAIASILLNQLTLDKLEENIQ